MQGNRILPVSVKRCTFKIGLCIVGTLMHKCVIYSQYFLSCCLEFCLDWVPEIPKKIEHSVATVNADVHSSFNAT